MIWSKTWTVDELHVMNRQTMGENLGLKFTEIGEDFICASMPVDHRTKQPAGLLHGGASVALAETLGSIASYMAIPNIQTHIPVGLEINANHLRGVRDGFVLGTARPLHMGRTTHVWEIKIENEEKKLVCVSRLTVAIVPRSNS